MPENFRGRSLGSEYLDAKLLARASIFPFGWDSESWDFGQRSTHSLTEPH